MYFKNYVHIILRQDLEHDEIDSMWFELKTKLRPVFININWCLLAIPTFCISLFWFFLYWRLWEEQYMLLLQNMLF